ncbi:MAG TPA: hypothetical protein VGS22_10675 [Thermoanaerobaculia bacterium]|nr:hypothetical protein [Thermoanaerobaculia bacterium]
MADLPPPPDPGDREALALGRLRRAAERSKKRSEAADVPAAGRKRAEIYARKSFAEVTKSRGNREVVRTPFGEVRFGRGPHNIQPYGTLDREDWGKGNLPRLNYDTIVGNLPKEGAKVQGVADEIGGFLANDAPPKPTRYAETRSEKASATLLSGLLAVAEPHEERNPVGGKPERAAIRRAGKVGFKRVFNRKKGEYVPAWADSVSREKVGGTSAWREIRGGSRPIPPRTLDLLDELSASSDDAAEKTPVRRRAVRRRSRKRKAAAETTPSPKAAPKEKRARSKPSKEVPEKKPARKAPRKRKRKEAIEDETKPPKKSAGAPPRKRKRV